MLVYRKHYTTSFITFQYLIVNIFFVSPLRSDTYHCQCQAPTTIPTLHCLNISKYISLAYTIAFKTFISHFCTTKCNLNKKCSDRITHRSNSYISSGACTCFFFSGINPKCLNASSIILSLSAGTFGFFTSGDMGLL